MSADIIQMSTLKIKKGKNNYALELCYDILFPIMKCSIKKINFEQIRLVPLFFRVGLFMRQWYLKYEVAPGSDLRLITSIKRTPPIYAKSLTFSCQNATSK